MTTTSGKIQKSDSLDMETKDILTLTAKNEEEKDSDLVSSDNSDNQQKQIKSKKKNEKLISAKINKSPKIPVKNSNQKDTQQDKEKNDIIINIDDELEANGAGIVVKNKEMNKKEKKKKKDQKATTKGNPQYVPGYNPFVFYEKVKFKEVDFKKVEQRQYVKDISLKWRNMTDEEKKPYVQMALDYKETHPIGEKKDLTKKKRKRGKSSDLSQEENDDNNNSKDKKSESKKKKKNSSSSKKNGKIKEKVDSDDKKKRNKSEIKDEKKKKEIQPTVSSDKEVNSYVNSILVPFVESSYDFFKNKGIIA